MVGTVDAREYLSPLPPEMRLPDAIGEIRRRLEPEGRRIAVLDDPTGTRSVHDVPVLTTWTVVNDGLAGAEVVVYTSREVVGGEAGRTGFEVGRAVSDALVGVMRRVGREAPPVFVVAKGGITSSDVGTRGLGVRRAEVAGQMLPGIDSAWVLPEESAFPGPPYVIFAGNVGGPDSLGRVIEILRGD